SDGPIRQGDAAFLRHVVIPDHVHRRGRRDHGDLLDLAGLELPVLDLDDVLPPHRAARDMHGDRDRRGHGIPDAEDLQDLQGAAGRDVIDHRPVLDRRDSELLHSPPPKIRSSKAMRTGRALEACLKYTACFVRSTSGAISARAYVREWTVRPYRRSPTKVTFCPSMEPFSSQIVYRSNSVCVGCCPAPSPALITGRSVNSAARRAAPSCGWRRTIASLYDSTIRIVSASVSPFWTEVPSVP